MTDLGVPGRLGHSHDRWHSSHHHGRIEAELWSWDHAHPRQLPPGYVEARPPRRRRRPVALRVRRGPATGDRGRQLNCQRRAPEEGSPCALCRGRRSSRRGGASSPNDGRRRRSSGRGPVQVRARRHGAPTSVELTTVQPRPGTAGGSRSRMPWRSDIWSSVPSAGGRFKASGWSDESGDPQTNELLIRVPPSRTAGRRPSRSGATVPARRAAVTPERRTAGAVRRRRWALLAGPLEEHHQRWSTSWAPRIDRRSSMTKLGTPWMSRCAASRSARPRRRGCRASHLGGLVPRSIGRASGAPRSPVVRPRSRPR